MNTNISLPTYPDLEQYISNIERYFDEVKKYEEKVLNIALNQSNKGFSVKTKTGYKLVSFCPIQNNWRLTYYDDKGWPMSHIYFENQRESYLEGMKSSIKFESIPMCEMSTDSKEEIIQRVKEHNPREFDILTLITFYHIHPWEVLRG